MQTIGLMLLTFAGYLVAYHTYGRYLGRKIFGVADRLPTPSHRFEDGRDFVPTKRGILFGHHFTSIAGTGPIVGPAIGVIWGWVPALLWIFLGSIFMGAVHDFGSLVLSLRNEGKSVSECAARVVGPRVRYLFFWIIFLELLIVIAIFGLVIAIVFARFPTAVLPVWLQIPIAVALGRAIAARSRRIGWWTVGAVAAMYATVWLGASAPLTMPALGGVPATGVWTLILLAYAFVASTLPVTALLQPRDYINAWQLTVAMGLLVLGVIGSGLTAGLEIVAPAFNLRAAGAPPIWPFLFITIACGAVSGFHCLVSSGTSSKQLDRESDAQFVGYGSMLFEAVLATLVLIAVAAGIGMVYETVDGEILTGAAAWQRHYASWEASQGMTAKISAVVVGSANMMAAIGVPASFGVVLIGVFIASFAGTTLDTATRLQRYVISELADEVRLPLLKNRFAATAAAVLTAAGLAFATGAGGKGALTLWPMFGGVNQLLAALALLALTNWLRSRGGRKWLVTALPCAFMLIMTLWSVGYNEIVFLRTGQWLLAFLNGATLLLAALMVGASFNAFRRGSAMPCPVEATG